MNQIILSANDNYKELFEYLQKTSKTGILLVCGKSAHRLKIGEFFEQHKGTLRITEFNDFEPNPDYESVVKGVSEFHKNNCDMIVAVGGGSAMDVAKCVKLFAYMDSSVNYIEQEIVPNDIPFVAVPTTAGTGSEATRYGVIYYQGNKMSITHVSGIPCAVLFDSTVLETLPMLHKKATMLDALCHAVEAYWSVNSNDESKEYSRCAIKMVLDNKDAYLNNDPEGNYNMLMAANIAGKAINITQTTAGHAMSYKLTSNYNLPHGQAAALCVKELLPYMYEHVEECTDSRGASYLKEVFEELIGMLGGLDAFGKLYDELGLGGFKTESSQEFEDLALAVNPTRLKNNPVKLDTEAIRNMYIRISENN